MFNIYNLGALALSTFTEQMFGRSIPSVCGFCGEISTTEHTESILIKKVNKTEDLNRF